METPMLTITIVGLHWFSVVSFGAIGIMFLVAPERWAATIGVAATNDTGRVDIRATYGGLCMSLGLFWVWCVLDPTRFPAGLWSMALVYGFLALGRILGALAGHRLDSKMKLFLATEVVVAAACIGIIATVP